MQTQQEIHSDTGEGYVRVRGWVVCVLWGGGRVMVRPKLSALLMNKGGDETRGS